jgi:outer membrane protein TolC
MPKLDEESGLSDYLAYAAMNNPGLKAAFYKWKEAVERVPQVSALPDPRFTYRYFIEEVETRVGPQRQSFELAQMIPWFGKLDLREDVAAQAAKAERQRFDAAKLKLFYRVSDAYYEYYYLWRAINTVRENLGLVKKFERVARTRYKTAAGSHPDIIRSQVELGKLEDRLRTLQDLRGPMAARLNAVLDRSPEADIPWPGDVTEPTISVTDAELAAWLAQFNPELLALDAEIVKNKYRTELAKKGYFPDVSLGVGYIDTASSSGGRRPSDDGKDPVVAMVSINLPIWWGKISAGVREARYSRLRLIHKKADRVNALNAELKLVLYRFRNAQRKIDLYRDSLLPKARQSIKATEASFRAGKASFLDLIDAERVLLEFQLAHERALANSRQRLAQLEMFVGRQIPRTPPIETGPTTKADTDSTKSHDGSQP